MCPADAMIDPALPLIDLHRHIEGCVRITTVLDLARAHGVELPAWDVEGLRPHVQVTEPTPGVMAFIARFRWNVAVLRDLEACRRIAYENVLDARGEGLDHVELRFSPWFMSEPHGHDPAAVVEAVVDGVESAARVTGTSVGLIGILSRTYGPDACRRELDALLTRADRLVALDLAGDEVAHPAPEFVDHFRRARDAGLAVTVHAGEADGARSIRDSIELLGAARIGHAVRAIDDPALMDLMAQRGVGIEANLTSNVQTSTVPDLASHPLRAFLERGLVATLNTDDPSISGIDLRHEYEVAAPAAGLTPAHARAAQANALALAFLPADRKRALAAAAAARAAG